MTCCRRLSRPKMGPGRAVCRPPKLHFYWQMYHRSVLCCFHGIIVNGLINVSISTIEKRYDLSSSLTGVISAGYDISFSVLCLFISFYGERGHKPRWLALSSFLIAVGALVFSLPHFTSGPYTYGEKAEGKFIYLKPVIISVIVPCQRGSRSKLSNYFYVFLLGQFLLGAGGTPLYTLGTTFIDDSVPKHQASVYIDLTPEDPRWVGAWWIAFVVCSFSTCLLMLLRNPVLMYLVIAAALEALVATGFATFLPKFIENQFGFTSSYSATLGGLVLVPGAAIGQIISGTLISKLQMNCKTIIKFIIATCTLALLLNMVFAFAKCGNEPFAGVSETYNGTGMLSNLTAPCNAHCRCLRSDFLPICGADEVQYFSPCYAGCTAVAPQKLGTKHYSNCSCVVNPVIEIENTFHGATSGKCKSKCTVLPWFLSTIPGPILFGISIDHSCTLWSTDRCGRNGACWTYNNTKMAYLLCGISKCACSKAISLIFTIISYVLYKPPPDIVADSKTQDQTSSSVRL
uniref:Solute carrier organic anion transporter family member 4C1 n=1 Tax=Naja naja TaxID=35670 RepID=A0A8C6VGM8_NAJNA